MNQSNARVEHLPDVDGLRALAVALVVLYHGGVPFLSGGFVGVDVFFVISGFVITRLIESELRAGVFSFSGFYARRIRRLLPAFVLVLSCTAIAAFLVLLPEDLVDFARSALASIAILANVYFWIGTDYFSASSELKPLLHTWSLSIEEQFYIAFPAFLLVVSKLRERARVAVVATVLLLSFLVSVQTTESSPGSAFYLLPSRVWEFLFGALLATSSLEKPRGLLVSTIGSSVGFAL